MMLRFLRLLLNRYSHITPIRKIFYPCFKVPLPESKVVLTWDFSFDLAYTRDGLVWVLIVFTLNCIDFLPTPDTSSVIQQRDLSVIILILPRSNFSLFTVVHCNSLLDSIYILLFLIFSKCNTAKNTYHIKCIRSGEIRQHFLLYFYFYKITKTQ